VTRSAENNRAQVVRQRRRQQTNKRLTESTTLATRPFAPITVRRDVTQPRPHRATAANSRRRAQASLSMPGIEVRMPSISFTLPQLKWRLLSTTLCLLLGAALYLAATAAAFRPSSPRIMGNERIPADEISQVLAVSDQQVFTLVPSELERRLRLNFPELTSAQVSVGLPKDVFVNIAERKPAIVWQQADGYTWIDDGGIAFRPRGTAENLVTVEAQAAPGPTTTERSDPLSPAPFISPDLVAAIRALAPHAPEGTPLIYDPQYGLGWADSRGWQAFFGQESRDMALRLRVYDSVVQAVGASGITPSLINVQYPSAPYYRMSQ
jgi:cell division septal protein FtsQ